MSNLYSHDQTYRTRPSAIIGEARRWLEGKSEDEIERSRTLVADLLESGHFPPAWGVTQEEAAWALEVALTVPTGGPR